MKLGNVSGLPRGGEVAGRLRAARGYAGLKQPALAKELGISVETLSRMENGRGTVSAETLDKIRQACGVPRAFLELGFAPLDRPVTDGERRVLELEERVDRRLDEIERLLAEGFERDVDRAARETRSDDESSAA